MKKFLAVVLIFVLVITALFLIPQLRVRMFVTLYHEQIEEGLKINEGVPADDAVIGGYYYVNSWGEDPEMTEFVILRYGKTYYGCYYSPEDVPFSFQNITDTLTEDGKNRWEWQLDEHNGYTSKIFDNWYYFKADY